MQALGTYRMVCYNHLCYQQRGVAQLVEHRSPKPGVVSSSLAAPAKLLNRRYVDFLF